MYLCHSYDIHFDPFSFPGIVIASFALLAIILAIIAIVIIILVVDRKKRYTLA